MYILHVNLLLTRVTNSNMVSIPSRVRHEMGIKPGDRLEWHTFGDIILLVPPRVEKDEELLSVLSGADDGMELAHSPTWGD